MIVDDDTIVVVNTSSCNMQTAKGIIRRDPRHMIHLKWQLNLGAAGPDLNRRCQDYLIERERKWRVALEGKIEKLREGRTGGGKGGKDAAPRAGFCPFGCGLPGWTAALVVVICTCLVQRAAVR